jgi:glutamate-1-semialdehyde aminotransferase
MQTENGKRNVAAVIFIPVSAEMAAEAPSSMFAQAMMLLMRQSTIQIRCAAVPGVYQYHYSPY